MFHSNVSAFFTVEEKAKQETRQQSELSLPPASTGFFLGLLFSPEDAGNMFLQNRLLHDITQKTVLVILPQECHPAQ
jgi:hypothetical protein